MAVALGATMFVAFGVLALALAAIGLYSVIAYNVAQRTHELGVRRALGAQASDVVRLVVTDGLRLAAIGVGIGVAGALWAGKWVKPLLFNVSPKDPWVFVAVATTLVAVALAASWIPAVRAWRSTPTSRPHRLASETAFRTAGLKCWPEDWGACRVPRWRAQTPSRRRK
jgi:ABC-type antimicrobial peptide transport system permease subunit